MMSKMGKELLRRILLITICVSIITGCAGFDQSDRTDFILGNWPPGYLLKEELPDSAALLPPPPTFKSKAFAFDKEVSKKSFVLRNTPRWQLARNDANLNFPQAAETFSCSLNAPINQQDTPHLLNLLNVVKTDAGDSTNRAKEKYHRLRPFQINNQPICTPNKEEKDFLEKNGSYPSGHAAIGWAWALLLTEISPDQSDAILARGLAFGDSRIICNVHWQSDVIEGRLMGASVIARLHADPIFRADIEAAKTELATVRANGLKPTRDCQAEIEALAR
ncbi:MAG: acid phosphatase [Smithella sp.]